MATCGHCGNEATGFASIDGVRYCHGDEDRDPTCYMTAQHGPISHPGRTIIIEGDLAREIFARAKVITEAQ